MRPACVCLLLLTAGGCAERVVDAVLGPPPVDAGELDGPPEPPDAAAPDLADAPEPDAPPDADPPDAAPVDAAPGARSCAEILARTPGAPDGMYTIFPAGAPLAVFCDMTTRGGGWTRVASEDFATPPMGFSRTTITTCGGFGSILGGHRQFGNDTVTATLPLRGVPHRELRVRFEFVVLDSWDSEVAFADIDGARVWSVRCDGGVPRTCNQTADQCGWDGTDRNDGKVPVDVTVAHDRPQATLTVGAVLDQNNIDESWGLDNLAVFVR